MNFASAAERNLSLRTSVHYSVVKQGGIQRLDLRGNPKQNGARIESGAA